MATDQPDSETGPKSSPVAIIDDDLASVVAALEPGTSRRSSAAAGVLGRDQPQQRLEKLPAMHSERLARCGDASTILSTSKAFSHSQFSELSVNPSKMVMISRACVGSQSRMKEPPA